MRDAEYLSPDEQATLKALQAKAKRIQRAKQADAKFFKLADARKDELLARWGISTSSPDMPGWMISDNTNDNFI